MGVTEFVAELKKLGLSLSPQTVRDYIAEGTIKGVRLGGRGNFKITRAELVRFLRDSGVEVAS
jgi:hypothetical protein